MSDQRAKVYHRQHRGLIGEYNNQLNVAYCSWCAVGYSGIHVPAAALEPHFEAEHPNVHSNMWEEYTND